MHFPGFNSYQEFKNSLEFVLPGLDRGMLIYWDSKGGKSSTIDTEKLFDKTEEGEGYSDPQDQRDIQNKTRDSAHKFSSRRRISHIVYETQNEPR